MASTPKILCIHGSPRAGGNSDRMLQAFVEGAQQGGVQVESLRCRELVVQPCVGCGHCGKTGDCRITDDDMPAVYAAVDAADAVVVGTGVYFLGPPAPLKAVIDRFQARWSRINVLGVMPDRHRPGAILAVGGAPVHSVFQCIHRIVEAWFDVIGVTTKINLFYEKIDARGDVERRPDIVEEARRAGLRMAGLLTAQTHR